MIKEYELHDALDTLAEDFARFDDNPITWHRWIIYLLGQLQQQAMDVNPRYQQTYEDMLSLLSDSIRTRLRKGSW